jgi:hypothetical protein
VSAEEFTQKAKSGWNRRPHEAELDYDALWKIIRADSERKKLYDEYSQLDMELWRTYYKSIFETHVIFMLGKYMTENRDSISILDVGSGPGKTAKALLSQVNSSAHVQYTSIDYKVTPSAVLEMGKDIEHEHHSFDALAIEEAELERILGEKKKQYDLIIIDIEPHYQEIALYQKFKQFLKEEHLCIIEHCFMQSYAGWGARAFLTKFVELGHVVDYYAQDEVDGRKDLYMVMKKTPLCEKTIFKCQALTKGSFCNYVAFARDRGERILEFTPP